MGLDRGPTPIQFDIHPQHSCSTSSECGELPNPTLNEGFKHNFATPACQIQKRQKLGHLSISCSPNETLPVTFPSACSSGTLLPAVQLKPENSKFYDSLHSHHLVSSERLKELIDKHPYDLLLIDCRNFGVESQQTHIAEMCSETVSNNQSFLENKTIMRPRTFTRRFRHDSPYRRAPKLAKVLFSAEQEVEINDTYQEKQTYSGYDKARLCIPEESDILGNTKPSIDNIYSRSSIVLSLKISPHVFWQCEKDFYISQHTSIHSKTNQTAHKQLLSLIENHLDYSNKILFKNRENCNFVVIYTNEPIWSIPLSPIIHLYDGNDKCLNMDTDTDTDTDRISDEDEDDYNGLKSQFLSNTSDTYDMHTPAYLKLFYLLCNDLKYTKVFLLRDGYNVFSSKFPSYCTSEHNQSTTLNTPSFPSLMDRVNKAHHRIFKNLSKSIDCDEPSKILSFLYLGNSQNAYHKDQMIKLGITHILNTAKECPNYHQDISVDILPINQLPCTHHQHINTYTNTINNANCNGIILDSPSAAICKHQRDFMSQQIYERKHQEELKDWMKHNFLPPRPCSSIDTESSSNETIDTRNCVTNNINITTNSEIIASVSSISSYELNTPSLSNLIKECQICKMQSQTKSEFKYLKVDFVDREEQDISSYFDEMFSFIDEARQGTSKVLVHCFMGMSRSAAVVIAYLMKYKKWTLKQAYKYVKKKRAITEPNWGFLRQLCEYEISLFGKCTLPMFQSLFSK